MIRKKIDDCRTPFWGHHFAREFDYVIVNFKTRMLNGLSNFQNNLISVFEMVINLYRLLSLKLQNN